ncbi:MAG: hypothetical protein VX130_01375 [Verrucomicrobiota bacterium]|nr:hypothetical protein [Verrucomicrobiota bacterium]
MKEFFGFIFFQVIIPVKVVCFCLFSFYLKANPYTLEHSLTGEETVRLSGHVYEFEVGWGASEPEEIDSREPYTLLDPVFAYLELRAEYQSGESVMMLEEGSLLSSGWRRAAWFGEYFSEFFPWVYHQNLGWLYVAQKNEEGVWFFHERMGWVWSTPSDFPYLYMINRTDWTYAHQNSSKPTLYDFNRREWFELYAKYRVSANTNPSQGGYVSGMGEFYRWEEVTLDAQAFDGFVFDHWSGDLQGENSQRVLEVLSDINVVANFRELPVVTPPPVEVEPPVPDEPASVNDLLEEVVEMKNISEKTKKKALAEILLYGKVRSTGLNLNQK